MMADFFQLFITLESNINRMNISALLCFLVIINYSVFVNANTGQQYKIRQSKNHMSVSVTSNLLVYFLSYLLVICICFCKNSGKQYYLDIYIY